MLEIHKTFCSRCARIRERGSWLRQNLASAVAADLKARYPKARIMDPDRLMLPKKGRRRIEIEFKAAETSHTALVILSSVLCDDCSRAASGYYEGILQIRHRDSPSYSRALQQALKSLEAATHIAKLAETKHGADIYVGSMKRMQIAAKEIQKRYGGEVLISRSLFTRNRQTSKNVYRLTVSLRLPDFKQGDVVTLDKAPLLVKSISGSSFQALNLLTGKHKTWKISEITSVLPADRQKRVAVTRTRPHLEVLHPETYQSTPVDNEHPVRSDTVLILQYRGKLHLLE